MSAATTMEATASTPVEPATCQTTTAVESATTKSSPSAKSTTYADVVAATVGRGSAGHESSATAVGWPAITARITAAVSTASISDTATSPTVAAIISMATPISMPVIVGVIVRRMTPVPPVPRPGADEEAADEPARSVVAIGRTTIWIVRIVAPRAVRRTVIHRSRNNRRTDTDTHCNLGIRSNCKRQRHKHCNK